MKTAALIVVLALGVYLPGSCAFAQSVLFDFNSAPLHASLPIDQTIGGITAHLSATGQGLSIQDYIGNNFVPIGFSGYFIAPNSINASDLLIRFDQAITDFAILYAPEEYGCDSSATMRVTAYMGGSFVGTNTKIAANPGTWPVDTLACTFPGGFDSVVVHYDHHPVSGCSNWGPIFAADNMLVTPMNPVGISDRRTGMPAEYELGDAYPNPFNPSATIRFGLPHTAHVKLQVYNLLGEAVRTLVDDIRPAGSYDVAVDGRGLVSGVYYYRIIAGEFTQTRKMVVVR